jgi:hypothetical protein
MASEIIAIDGNSGLAGWVGQIVNRFAGQLPSNFGKMETVTVYSVKDMVEKTILAAGADKIKHLTILGHAASGTQCVGCGSIGNVKIKTGEDFLSVSLVDGKLYNRTEDYLAKLVPKFAFDGIVSLGGCQVAAPPDGDTLLRRVSEVLKVPVEGGVDNQRPLFPGYEGNVVRCNGNLCFTMPATPGY